MIVMAWEGSMFVWVLSVCTRIFGGLLDGNGGCVWERLSSYGWLSGLRVHIIKGGLLCGGNDHGQS